jgi:C-3',4' desaturase CrtD
MQKSQVYDVAALGGGIAGMATAARLQSRGLSTVVFEAHGQPGGCAGFFRRSGFAFDVGATTLVDFGPGGVGGELLESIGLEKLPSEALPGYRAWLPDRVVSLYRDPCLWETERLCKLGDSPRHRQFWSLLDRLAHVFWNACRTGIKLPIHSISDVIRIAKAIPVQHWPLARYLHWTVGDALRHFHLHEEAPLVGLLSMLLQDTVHASVEEAPLINGALGITIRGAGLSRARGGMFGFWRHFREHYATLGGTLRVGCAVRRVRITGPWLEDGPVRFAIETRRGEFQASQVVSALPAELTARIGPGQVRQGLEPYLMRDKNCRGGALVLFLGVPEQEVQGQDFTHHQLLQDYRQPLGNGNNMFISVSASGDTDSAPAGFRSVMISTHCDLADWETLNEQAYQAQKNKSAKRLLELARGVYPLLGTRAAVCEMATPRTFERFTKRPRGAVGGVQQNLTNSNQHAIPHATKVPGFWLAGDTTWPGLGTVACVLGSRLVAEAVLDRARRLTRENPLRRSRIIRKENHEPAKRC